MRQVVISPAFDSVTSYKQILSAALTGQFGSALCVCARARAHLRTCVCVCIKIFPTLLIRFFKISILHNLHFYLFRTVSGLDKYSGY